MRKKILEVKNLKVHFKQRGGPFKASSVVRAVDGVDFEVFEGETLGIVGESGSGKSSLARALCGLNPITEGIALFDGRIDLAKATGKQWNEVHRHLQFVFQDPIAALNPRMTIAEIIAEPLITFYPRMSKREVMEKVISTMKLVGLTQTRSIAIRKNFPVGSVSALGLPGH